MTTLYHTLFVDRMYSLEHNNMTSLSISKWRLREIGVPFINSVGKVTLEM